MWVVCLSTDLCAQFNIATIRWTCLNVFIVKQISGLVFVRYLIACFATIRWTCLNVFIAKQVYGLVFVMYIVWWYIVASTDFDEATLNSFRFDGIGVAMHSIILNLFRISTAYFFCPRKIPSTLFHTSIPRTIVHRHITRVSLVFRIQPWSKGWNPLYY